MNLELLSVWVVGTTLSLSPSAEESSQAEMGNCCMLVLCLCVRVCQRKGVAGVTHMITLADWGLFLAGTVPISYSHALHFRSQLL